MFLQSLVLETDVPSGEMDELLGLFGIIAQIESSMDKLDVFSLS